MYMYPTPNTLWDLPSYSRCTFLWLPHRLQSVVIAPHCLVPDSRMMLRKQDSGSPCENSIKEVVGGHGPWADGLARERHALGGV